MRFELLKKRKIAKMTQAEVGKAIGMDRFAYSRIENGKGKVTVDIALKLAKLFNCSVEDIFLPDSVENIHTNEHTATKETA